jgi:hypothetical protein
MTAHPDASGTVTQGRADGEHPDAPGADGARRRRRGRPGRRGRRVAARLVVVAAAAGGAAAWSAGAFSPAGSSAGEPGAPAPATQPVTRQYLASQTPVGATLGYAGSYTVTGKGGGTLTWLPSAGHVIHQGNVLYRTDNGVPVVLLYGRVPAWRTLDEGVTGSDVTQLNHDLVRLGDADSSEISSLGWDYFSWETQAGVEKLQSAVGISSPSGSLTLGSVVFEPEALRVSNVIGSLGNPASGPILAATSDRHEVTVALDAAQQSQVKPGDAVTVMLPDGSSTPGVITSVGAVASGSGSSATIPVHVRLTRPGAAGTLDQAPVTVEITSASVSDALSVPVAALLAQSSGGYAVEVIGPGNSRRLMPVTVGPIFDDNAGRVQVTGNLTPGQRVVVPAT